MTVVLIAVIIVLVILNIWQMDVITGLKDDLDKANTRTEYIKMNKRDEEERADYYQDELFLLKDLVEKSGFIIKEVEYPEKELVKIKKK